VYSFVQTLKQLGCLNLLSLKMQYISNLGEKENVKQWTFKSVQELVVICLIPTLLLIFFLLLTFRSYPAFDDLETMKGMLMKVGKCNDNNKSWLTLAIDGKRGNIEIPCSQQVSRLSEEIGNVIEIRFKPRSNIWNISSNRKVYFEYKIKYKQLQEERLSDRNILALSLIYTLVIYLVNIRAINEYISKLPAIHRPPLVNVDEEITFEPCRFKLGIGYLIYISSLPTIGITYFGIFGNAGILLMDIPLLVLIFAYYLLMKKQIEKLTFSREGIVSELFIKTVKKNKLQWFEIDDIDTVYDFVGGLESLQIAATVEKKSYTLNLYTFNYENGYHLKDHLFQRYNSSKRKI
jgi:hypothetical protein